jgi:3-carboxy-cis,cis-muconate cycloisomerase
MFPAMLSSALYGDLFGTAEMRAVFDDAALVRRWLEVEVALARAEARLGLVPTEAAEAIATTAAGFEPDFAHLRDGIERTGHPLVPFVEAFARSCPNGSGEYVHWGATTQDIMDTAVVLQLRDALAILSRQLGALADAISALALEHRATPLAGRTHGQHALPITFGFKLAVIEAELERHEQRLAELRPRLLVVQLSGAVGTLASLHPYEREVLDGVARELGLESPPIAWHTARDAFAELVAVAAMLGATCAKLASEVILLQKTEVAELAEPATDESVGSSTMPQKRNPMLCEGIVAIGRLLASQPGVAISAMVHQHERDMGAWQAEWAFLPETAILASGSLELTTRVVSRLEVDPIAMRTNLGATDGLIMAEAVMMALAPHMGRQRAHHVVSRVARETVASGRPFVECLLETEDVATHLDEASIRAALDPISYLGEAAAAVDRVAGARRGASPRALLRRSRPGP